MGDATGRKTAFLLALIKPTHYDDDGYPITWQIDETNTRIRPDGIARDFRRDGSEGLVCLVSVQSNPLPRAVDLVREFLALGLPVAIGGFHVTGSSAMLR
jgi:hypothetical protein